MLKRFLSFLLLVAVCPVANAEVVSVVQRADGFTIDVAPNQDLSQPVEFHLAIPADANLRATRLGGVMVERPMTDAEVAERVAYYNQAETPEFPTRPLMVPAVEVEVSPPLQFRGYSVVKVTCAFLQTDVVRATTREWGAYTVELAHGAVGMARSQAVDPAVRNFVVNTEFFPAIAETRQQVDPGFSLSSNWVRLVVDSRAMHEVTGADLQAAGIALTSVGDPATFRVFTGDVVEQPRAFADPRGTWQNGNWLNEVAIVVEDGNDGTFDPSDRIVFYGLGANDWLEYYQTGADPQEWHEHSRAFENNYFLTWGGSFAGSPRRMTATPSTPNATTRTSAQRRLYFESNSVSDYDYRCDGWFWLQAAGSGSFSSTIQAPSLSNVVVSVPQTFRSPALAPFRTPANVGGVEVNRNHHIVFKSRVGAVTTTIGEYTWDVTGTGGRCDAQPIAEFSGTFLSDGINNIIFEVPRDLNPLDEVYLDWISASYERRLVASGNRLHFSLDDTAGVHTVECTGFASSGQLQAFDVTDPFSPQSLVGVEITGTTTRTMRFSADGSQRRHFYVAGTINDGFRKPTSVRRITPTDLRAGSEGPHMVIIAPREFASAAERLADHRRQVMPHFANPRVQVVTTTDIYDNFSGGLPDVNGIRNYFKFLYENFSEPGGAKSLMFACLLGDATVDPKLNGSNTIDQVPTYIYFTQASTWVFATDAWYADMEAADQIPGASAGDIFVGRLPASTPAQASFLVDKVIGYDTANSFGEWRQKVVLVADDEVSGISSALCDYQFVSEQELVSKGYVAQHMDVNRVYLTDFPRISKIKPAARQALIDTWNDGALVLSYVGHGSSQQMADEQVFLPADVNTLNNGDRLPLFMAFSCTIGDFANSQRQSLSEQLLLRGGGGVIGAVCASNLTFQGANQKVHVRFQQRLTPREPGDAMAVGEALFTARSAAKGPIDLGADENNHKYNLMGDPATRLFSPRQEIRLEGAEADNFVAGVRKTLRGAVYKNGSVDTGFNGQARLLIREPDFEPKRYFLECINVDFIDYRAAAGVMYDGVTQVTNGEFELTFRVPRAARNGPYCYIAAYADNGFADASVAYDSTYSLVPPTPADSTELQPLDGAPRVAMGFQSGLKTVKPGESLRAVVRDRDGVNTLSTTNEGKHLLLIDDTDIPFDVTKFFEYDAGGTDTAGTMVFPLPALDYGQHSAVYKVSDRFGQTALDTLSFFVTDPSDFFARAVLNYPNPFAENTQFLFEISDRADIQLDVFTLSGQRIRRLNASSDGGQTWVAWDGRDEIGGEIANGTYLYVARVSFYDIDRPDTVLRGKVFKAR